MVKELRKKSGMKIYKNGIGKMTVRGWKLLSVCLILAVFLCGCVEETDFEGAEILEEIDVSQIAYPDKISVYETSFLEYNPETAIDAFSRGEEVVVENSYGEGMQYLFSENGDRGISFYDGGLSFYGEIQPGHYRNGFNYFDALGGEGWEYLSYSIEKMEQLGLALGDEYFREGAEELEATLQDSSVQSGVKNAQNIMNILNLPYYQLQSAYYDDLEDLCLMFWRQEIDSIPIASISLFSQQQGIDCYNTSLGINSDLRCMDSVLHIQTLDGKIIDWYFGNIVNVDKKTGDYATISPESAYELVRAVYEKKDPSCNPRFQNAELQYLSIRYEDSGKKLIYPVWVFKVLEDGYIEQGSETVKYTFANFFVIDAVTGEWFTGDVRQGEME